MMCFSISSIATGERLIPSTQADSQGAGHILPVNSGKLFVDARMRYASSHFPSYTASLNSGMTLPSGHPEWQKGIPQFMHRAACRFSSSSLYGCTNSLYVFFRFATGSFWGSARSNSLNPVGFPILSFYIVVYASTNFFRRTFLYSRGNTLMKHPFSVFQFCRMAVARLLPVR